MRVSISEMSAKVVREILPASKVKIFKRSKPAITLEPLSASESKTSLVPTTEFVETNDSPDYRENEMRIQMLSRSLYRQIFSPTEPLKDASLMQKYYFFKSKAKLLISKIFVGTSKTLLTMALNPVKLIV